MDNNPIKRTQTNSPSGNSPCKIKKMDWNQSTINSSDSINSKMNNIAKLRQQFVEEIKDIEHSLNESIQILRHRISEIDKKNDFMTEKLRQANKVLYNQSEIIYNKEQDNKVIREKVEELYEYQKSIVENMEDISDTLNIHENLSHRLSSDYDNLILMQQSHNNQLGDKLKKITPDEKFLTELNEAKLKIKDQEREIFQKEEEINLLEIEIKKQKIHKEEQHKQIQELDKKIDELEARNKTSKLHANLEKNKLLNEIDKLEQESKTKATESAELDKTIYELNTKLKASSINKTEIEQKIVKMHSEKDSLLKESEQLDKQRYENDKKNHITFEKLRDHLKTSQNELAIKQQNAVHASDVLQKKIADFRTKLKSYEGVESKLEKIEVEIKKEEESIMQINKEHENKKQELDNKIEEIDMKKKVIKVKINQGEEKVFQFSKEIDLIGKEIKELNEKLKIKLKAKETHAEELLSSEEMKDKEKHKNRRKLYTPTVADDDLEIDLLPLEEQFTQLTQANSSQSESPEKAKKFFKHSTSSQTKTKKESTPRSKGKAKKH